MAPVAEHIDKHRLEAEVRGKERQPSSGKFEVRLDAGAYGPGDEVGGTIVATEAVKARGLSAELRYIDTSGYHTRDVTHAETGILHEGTVEPGLEHPFALRLPEAALPSWDLLDAAGAEDRGVPQPPVLRVPRMASKGDDEEVPAAARGRLLWAIVVCVDVPWGFDVEELHRLPLVEDRSRWRELEPEAREGEMRRTVKRWDVEIVPDRWALRRGEALGLEVRIEEPAAGRDTLRAGLLCEAQIRLVDDAEGDPSWRREKAFEEWAPLDPTLPNQRVELRVPADAPFSYESLARASEPPRGRGRLATFAWHMGWTTTHGDDAAFGFRWMAVARESRRIRDPRREAILQVLP